MASAGALVSELAFGGNPEPLFNSLVGFLLWHKTILKKEHKQRRVTISYAVSKRRRIHYSYLKVNSESGYMLKKHKGPAAVFVRPPAVMRADILHLLRAISAQGPAIFSFP